MTTLLWYALAALGEIAGCFAFWAWLRLGKSPLWTLPGVVSLVIFALALTRIRKHRSTKWLIFVESDAPAGRQ